MKYFYALLLIFHGFLHLIGFIKAFFSTEIFNELLNISKLASAMDAIKAHDIKGIRLLGHRSR